MLILSSYPVLVTNCPMSQIKEYIYYNNSSHICFKPAKPVVAKIGLTHNGDNVFLIILVWLDSKFWKYLRTKCVLKGNKNESWRKVQFSETRTGRTHSMEQIGARFSRGTCIVCEKQLYCLGETIVLLRRDICIVEKRQNCEFPGQTEGH